MTVDEALRQAAAAGLDRLDAQMLLLFALGRSAHDRAWLLAHGDHPVPGAAERAWHPLCQRRQSGEPVAYLLGEKAFAGLTLWVDDRVLVPRPDTEVLVEWALQQLSDAGAAQPLHLLDLGTGSGAVALAVAARHPAVRVTATDVSASALEVARANGERLGLAVEWLNGHWFEALPGRRFNLIVSNPPYLAEGDRHLAALSHEPVLALTSGVDGLQDLRLIVDGAPAALLPGGWLLLEHGHDQAVAVCQLLRQRGFDAVTSRPDLAGIERCSGGCWRDAR